MFKFHCPHCQQKLSAEAAQSGAMLECPTCGVDFVIPSPMDEVAIQPQSPEEAAEANSSCVVQPEQSNQPEPSPEPAGSHSFAERLRDGNKAAQEGAKFVKQGALVGWAGLKRRSKQAALKAHIEKLRNIDLRKALHSLGKKAFEQGVVAEGVAEQFQAIRDLDARIAEMHEKAVVDTGETKMAALKRVSKDTAKASQAQALTVKREHLITELGREIHARNAQMSTEELSEESAAITDIEHRIRDKEVEMRALDDGGKSGMQTLAVAAVLGLLAIAGALMGMKLLGDNGKRENFARSEGSEERGIPSVGSQSSDSAIQGNQIRQKSSPRKPDPNAEQQNKHTDIQEKPKLVNGKSLQPPTIQQVIDSIVVQPENSSYQTKDKIEESSRKAISQIKSKIDIFIEISQRLEASFNAAGGEKMLNEVHRRAGSYCEILVLKTLVDPSFKALGSRDENIYEVNFVADGRVAIVVTELKLATGRRGGINLRFRETIEVSLVNGGKDAREVYVETQPLSRENEPEIIRIHDAWQAHLELIDELGNRIKRIEARSTDAIAIVEMTSELMDAIKVPELIISPRLAKEGFSAAIKDRKFDDVLTAIKSRSLVKILSHVESSSYSGLKHKIELIDNYIPTDERELPEIEETKRLFVDLVEQDFKVEFFCSDPQNVIENEKRRHLALQERYYITIPNSPNYMRKFSKRSSGFEHQMDCHPRTLLEKNIKADRTGYIVEVPIFSCAAIAFSYTQRPAAPGEEKRTQGHNDTIALSQDNQELLLSFKNKIKAAEQAYESGKTEKGAYDKTASSVPDEYLSAFKELLTRY